MVGEGEKRGYGGEEERGDREIKMAQEGKIGGAVGKISIWQRWKRRAQNGEK